MKQKLHFIYIGLFFFVGISATLLLTISGFDYYNLPIEERVFSIKHTSLKPSGSIGHGIGILGSLMMTIGVLSYMARKRFRFLFQFGYLKNWLEFHIFLCTVGPILVLFHTAFKFGGIVAVSFWSMVVVVLSGFVGRFIYIQIPRTIQGHELTAEEYAKMENELNTKMQSELSLSEKINSQLNSIYNPAEYLHLTIRQSLIKLLTNYFSSIKVLSRLKKKLLEYDVLEKEKVKLIMKVAKSKIILSRRIGSLRTMQKLFRYWHIFHLPFALSMFIIMVIHVVITILFGYKWIF